MILRLLIGGVKMVIDVPVEKAYKLLGNGPLVMVSAAYDNKINVMTNAWNCSLDFNPSKVLLVLSSESITRMYAEQSGSLVINIPSGIQKDLVLKVGSCHGNECDKFEKFSINYRLGNSVTAPLIDGCLAWLECKIIPDLALSKYDMIACEVIKAQAQDFYFKDNNIVVSSELNQSCIHHAGEANFYSMGKIV